MIASGKQFSLDSRMDLVSTMNPKDGDDDEDKGRINSVS